MSFFSACRLAFATVTVTALATGCAATPAPTSPGLPEGLRSPFTGYESAHYKDPSAWLCLPGRDDACAADLTATEIRPDGSRVAAPEGPPRPEADKVDCFYVYPTVDLSWGPANHQGFVDKKPMTEATVVQVARLRQTCRLFVPLYRQVTIGTYFRSHEVAEEYFKVAASDVMDAFVHYMGQWNAGRKVVLVGHSQGGQMVVRLLQRFFDDDPLMRERLLLAMPIGWPLDTATGSTVGGTFAHLPVCTRPGETGCVVAYRSFIAGTSVNPGPDAPPKGHESVCVNPATLDADPPKRGPQPMSRGFIPILENSRRRLQGVEGITTPFVLLRDFYRAECVREKDGFGYLAIAPVATGGVPEDTRVNPIDFSNRFFHSRLGLHILDFQFAQGDLVDLVARRAAALP